MTPGFLVGVVLGTTYTALALVPLRRPRALATVGFLATLALNELPLYAAAWLAVSTLPAVLQGDVTSVGGWVVFGVSLLATAGLVEVARRGLRAGPVVERALRDGLGAEWATAFRSGSRFRFGRALVWPFPIRPWTVRRVADLRYGDAGRRHRLDVYHRRSRPSGAPVLVYLHGGGFFMGGKHREGRALLHRLARQGWVCVSANYRLRPHATFPDHLVDAKRVLAWVREHGHAYGADTSTLVMSGSSAGAHLAALCALTPGDPELQPGFEDADTSVSAAVCLYGYYGYYYGGIPGAEPVPSSPNAHVGPHAPPFFLAHGDQDTMVPVEGAREFVARLRESSTRPVVYAELPGAQHAFDVFASPRFEAVVGGVEAFVSCLGYRAAPPAVEATSLRP